MPPYSVLRVDNEKTKHIIFYSNHYGSKQRIFATQIAL